MTKHLFVSMTLMAVASGCGGGSGGGSGGNGDPQYAVASLVFDPNGTTSYISLLPSLGAQTIDYSQAREVGGSADLWAYDGAVFIAQQSDVSITRFEVEDGQLVEKGKISLANYGATEVGFWRNTFISPTKAYFLNGSHDYILWNPTAMAITGTAPLPALEERAGYKIYPGYSDRAAVLRGRRLYQPMYWTDDSFFQTTPDSRIIVFDVDSDQPVEVLTAPCPGLDYATVDDAGNIYFSSWIFAAGGALVLHQPDTCVAKLAADGGAPTVAFKFTDVTGGRQGAAFRYIGNGRAIFSALHGEHTTIDETTNAGAVTYADNWRFWRYQLGSGESAVLDAFDWNDGGHYSFTIDGKTYTLVSKSDYSATTAYDLGDGSAPARLFDTRGWSTRLFKVK
jgi:hypothetical protein